jgi:hypothetical protein
MDVQHTCELAPESPVMVTVQLQNPEGCLEQCQLCAQEPAVVEALTGLFFISSDIRRCSRFGQTDGAHSSTPCCCLL